MKNLNEKVSYLKGLIEGIGYDTDTKEGKILTCILEILSDMSESIIELDASHSEMDEYVEAIDEDLADLEDYIIGTTDDDDEDTGHIEIECPHCHENVYFDEDFFDNDDDILCPNCREPINSEAEDKN